MDSLFLKYFAQREKLPQMFREAVERNAPGTQVEVLEPGATLTVGESTEESERGIA
jgi:hypothetical protein